jgi:shikimate dehydrogenase
MVHPKTRELDWKIRGLSVTAPHKSSVMEHLDWIDPAAKEIGAVNTIKIGENGLSGYNTDVIGFIGPLVERLGSLNGLRCAVIGAGGGASAAVWALGQTGARVTVFARAPERAFTLARKFGAESCDLEAVKFEGFDVVVNATPLGTAGQLQSETPADESQLRGARLAYDLVYNPVDTRFLQEAQQAGCERLGGMDMLLAQAGEQFRIWTGVEPPKGAMRAAGRSVRETL